LKSPPRQALLAGKKIFDMKLIRRICLAGVDLDRASAEKPLKADIRQDNCATPNLAAGMHPRAILPSMALSTIANGTALNAEKIFSCHFARPRTLAFGSSISGRSLVGGRSLDRQKPSSESYGGDLFPGFLKHHLNLLPSSQALGLDQVPESLFALLACRYSLSLTAIDIVVGIGIFGRRARPLAPA
jgi:hypothetical protein